MRAQPDMRHPGSSRRLRRSALMLVGVVAALLACGRGYRFDIFPEMHYQPSQRRQEPPHVAAPADAVPVTGKEPPLTADQAAALPNPVPVDPQTAARGAELYRVNCAMCHGAQGRGDGILAGFFRSAGVPPPADLASPTSQQRSDGELFYVISYGRRDEQTLAGMPPFRTLLSPEERWTLVHHLRSLGGAPASG